jgi:hypothetical protein
MLCLPQVRVVSKDKDVWAQEEIDEAYRRSDEWAKNVETLEEAHRQAELDLQERLEREKP